MNQYYTSSNNKLHSTFNVQIKKNIKMDWPFWVYGWRDASGKFYYFNGKLKKGNVSLLEWLAAKYCYTYPPSLATTTSLHVYWLSNQQFSKILLTCLEFVRLLYSLDSCL